MWPAVGVYQIIIIIIIIIEKCVLVYVHIYSLVQGVLCVTRAVCELKINAV